uniref:Ig-like domain-containing protein n=1 Tax=Maylandia zebra TaxID=106582 RepID=A0A3P9BEM5_9CICH
KMSSWKFQQRCQWDHSHQLSSVRQDRVFISTNVGESVTLQCFYEGEVVARLYWYKQTLGQKPRLISTYYRYEGNGIFYNEFKSNPRFTLVTGISKNHLKITDLRVSDSATYYCATSFTFILEFTKETYLNVKGSSLDIQTFVLQSLSETIQPGGSVTLNCTVRTGTCDEDHKVYWFKDSEDSHPGLIYTHGGRNDECKKKSEAQAHTCVYSLPMKNLNVSHVGSYYCAVALCGRLLFGNGTKLNVEDEADTLLLLYFWRGVSAFTSVLSVLLASLMCMMRKKNSSTYTEGGYLYFKPLRDMKMNRSEMQMDNTWSKCVYSSVKQ